MFNLFKRTKLNPAGSTPMTKKDEIIRPEVQKLINYINNNKDSFKYDTYSCPNNTLLHISGISNGAYLINYMGIYNLINDNQITLTNAECNVISTLIVWFQYRDVELVRQANDKKMLNELVEIVMPLYSFINSKNETKDFFFNVSAAPKIGEKVKIGAG